MEHKETFINEAIEEVTASSKDSTIYVGCDSNRFRKKGNWFASYATVVIVHKGSKHGCKVVGDVIVLPDYGNLRQRLFQEVMFATDCAMQINDAVGDRNLEVHLDINTEEQHKSSIAVKEAIGYVLGMGFKPKVKPEAFAASSCADHYCRI
tara:strand:+ start:161 stop:613 length:453 start_codon:yes stop_codon:yes gene_type:complete